jgi:hypothetical protein
VIYYALRPATKTSVKAVNLASPVLRTPIAAAKNIAFRVHPVDHTPLLTAPELVVDIILEAARETLTS